MARRVGLLFLINLALVGGFRFWAGRFEAPGGPSVLDLELSFTAGAFEQVLQLWGAAHPDGVQEFKWSVAVLDTLFPPAYAALLSTLYTWVVRTGGRRPLRAGQLAPWIAAGLDWIENGLLLILLFPVHDAVEIADTTFPSGPVAMMSTVAALKLALLVVPSALTLVSLFVGPRGRVLARCRFSVLSVVLGSLPLILLPQGRDLLLTLGDRTFSGLVARTAFVTFLVVWAASVWYWARVLVAVRREDEPAPTPDERFFATWTPRALGTATLALPAVAFLGAMSIAGRGERESRVMLLFAIACSTLAAAFWFFVRHRRGWQARVKPQVDDVTTTYPFSRIPASMRRAAALSLVVSLMFFALFTGWPLTVAARLGAVTVLLVAAANTVFFGSLAVLFGRLLGLPLVAVGLLAAAVFSRWNDNHDVRLASADAAGRVAARPGLADSFREWLAPLQAACAGCPDVPVYLVAAEGGGIRAAYWTAGVLTHLQDGRPDFVRHLFAISGVSGGSVGAVVFASLVRDGAGARLPCSGSMEGRATLEPCASEVLSGPFLTPTLAKMVTGDVAQWFLPVAFPAFDRARALEGAWARAYRGATGRDTLAAPYLDSWPGPAAGLPALILNGTHVQTGRRVIATPFSWTSADIPDSYDQHLLLGADLPLATAMHNSARFSYLSPAGHLRTVAGEDRGYVVDGGYFENSGAATLNDVLHVLRRAPVAPGPPPRFVVVYLCNNPERCFVPAIDVAGDTAWRPAENMAEWVSPLRALLGAREARGSAALAELRREVGPEAFVELGVCRRLASQERAAPLPLGWQISDRVRTEMDKQVRDPVCGAAPIP